MAGADTADPEPATGGFDKVTLSAEGAGGRFSFAPCQECDDAGCSGSRCCCFRCEPLCRMEGGFGTSCCPGQGEVLAQAAANNPLSASEERAAAATATPWGCAVSPLLCIFFHYCCYYQLFIFSLLFH